MLSQRQAVPTLTRPTTAPTLALPVAISATQVVSVAVQVVRSARHLSKPTRVINITAPHVLGRDGVIRSADSRDARSRSLACDLARHMH